MVESQYILLVKSHFHDMGLISKKITSGKHYLSGGKKDYQKVPEYQAFRPAAARHAVSTCPYSTYCSAIIHCHPPFSRRVQFPEILKITILLFYYFYFYNLVNFYILHNNSKSLKI